MQTVNARVAPTTSRSLRGHRLALIFDHRRESSARLFASRDTLALLTSRYTTKCDHTLYNMSAKIPHFLAHTTSQSGLACWLLALPIRQIRAFIAGNKLARIEFNRKSKKRKSMPYKTPLFSSAYTITSASTRFNYTQPFTDKVS